MVYSTFLFTWDTVDIDREGWRGVAHVAYEAKLEEKIPIMFYK